MIQNDGSTAEGRSAGSAAAQADTMECQTLTIAEAARVLGVSKSLAYALADTGVFPAKRLGGRLVVPRAQLLRWLQE